MNELQREIDVKQIRPWVRYWARLIDISIGGILVGWISILIPNVTMLSILLTALLSLILMIFLEALLLSTWGMTPGKSLFQVFVRNSQGGKLDFWQAIKRCISVWFWGLGLGIPLVSFVLTGMSKLYLQEKGVAKWDRSGKTQVRHKRIGIPRIVIIVSLAMGFVLYTFTRVNVR